MTDMEALPEMACYLLHVLEQQDPSPYDDPDVRDVVGTMPQFFCTKCQPLLRLTPGEGMKCIGRDAPCWMPADRTCPEELAPAADPWDPQRL